MKIWRGQPDNWVWKPTSRDIARFWIGIGIAFFGLGAVHLLSPSPVSRTGLWAWLHIAFFNAFGNNSEIVLFGTLGTACLIYGAAKWRRN